MQALQRIREMMELIVCPACHGRLSLDDSTSAATVACSSCARRYPIEDGIPVLLESRAALPGA